MLYSGLVTLSKLHLIMSLDVSCSLNTCAHIIVVGFKSIGYRGLETGSRSIVSHAVSQNGIKFIFQSPLNPGNQIMGDHMKQVFL